MARIRRGRGLLVRPAGANGHRGRKRAIIGPEDCFRAGGDPACRGNSTDFLLDAWANRG
jgi:hypothetical protein